jgi:hypothetical protein
MELFLPEKGKCQGNKKRKRVLNNYGGRQKKAGKQEEEGI